MLVLARLKDQSIIIGLKDGQEIRATLLKVNSKVATLGITAPEECPVHREEVWKRIQEEGER